MVFEEELICAYAPQVGRSECEKDQSYNDRAREWDLQNPGEVILSLEDFNKHVGRRIDGFEGMHWSMKLAKEMFRKKDY